jgi:hypothetical protein
MGTASLLMPARAWLLIDVDAQQGEAGALVRGLGRHIWVSPSTRWWNAKAHSGTSSASSLAARSLSSSGKQASPDIRAICGRSKLRLSRSFEAARLSSSVRYFSASVTADWLRASAQSVRSFNSASAVFFICSIGLTYVPTPKPGQVVGRRSVNLAWPRDISLAQERSRSTLRHAKSHPRDRVSAAAGRARRAR